ncbi:hypothetical protein [Anabaena lutea]|uniref:Uncharacterized protein n=1 Tax=Anabaena lutea FACHB-196 TaxID=2692881 RepID=A0ABR8FC61_9NOST|nr:hypothetical protein [Anabaena lutea]MBD2567317.1 hypothetical protein [Anabaena lutea FACHB-196]
MNFPLQIQRKIEKLASSQGISTEQFVLQAVTEKIHALTQKKVEEDTEQNSDTTNVTPLNQAKVYRKEGILVVDAELPENFDFNTFIDELREERIRDQMAL